jgi:hypothetical protein
MALKFPAAYRNTRGDSITTRAGNGAKLRIYSGTRPANADTAPAGVLLAELVCGTPFAPAASGGVVTANAITTSNAVGGAPTNATWCRLVDSAGTTTACDGDVSATGGGGDLQLVSVSITSGQPVQVTSFVVTEGGG